MTKNEQISKCVNNTLDNTFYFFYKVKKKVNSRIFKIADAVEGKADQVRGAANCVRKAARRVKKRTR